MNAELKGNRMKKLCTVLLTVLIVTQAFAALAQEAPVPRRSPRTPVNREALADRKPMVAPSSTVQGLATVIDSEKIRIGEIDVRLFGIVPPQLSASFGPQARAALDKLVTSQPISCTIRDRDQAGRFLATCHGTNNNDLAIELLRRGLAVTARGSLSSTDLAQPYMAAEQAAESQKLGLWSGVTPPPATAPAAAVVVQAAPVATPAPVVEAKKEDKQPTKAETIAVKAPAPAATSTVTFPDEEMPLPIMVEQGSNFFTRYQLLITGMIILMTALSILGVIVYQRRQEKIDEMKAIAAALRGELTAARGVCLARLKTIKNEEEDKVATWPRIRVTLYQAYVGRLGWLGADLARKIASIYGQASDYAAYYNSDDETKIEATPKRQALQTLINYIDEVLPKLEQIERTGARFSSAPPLNKAAPLVEKSITTGAMPASILETDSAIEPTAMASQPIWETLRRFTSEHFPKQKTEITTAEDYDYAAMVEEEMSHLTFGEAEETSEPTSVATNVTSIRTGS